MYLLPSRVISALVLPSAAVLPHPFAALSLYPRKIPTSGPWGITLWCASWAAKAQWTVSWRQISSGPRGPRCPPLLLPCVARALNARARSAGKACVWDRIGMCGRCRTRWCLLTWFIQHRVTRKYTCQPRGLCPPIPACLPRPRRLSLADYLSLVFFPFHSAAWPDPDHESHFNRVAASSGAAGICAHNPQVPRHDTEQGRVVAGFCVRIRWEKTFPFTLHQPPVPTWHWVLPSPKTAQGKPMSPCRACSHWKGCGSSTSIQGQSRRIPRSSSSTRNCSSAI